MAEFPTLKTATEFKKEWAQKECQRLEAFEEERKARLVLREQEKAAVCKRAAVFVAENVGAHSHKHFLSH